MYFTDVRVIHFLSPKGKKISYEINKELRNSDGKKINIENVMKNTGASENAVKSVLYYEALEGRIKKR